MTKPRVVIEIKGGALIAAYCDDEIELVLVDWDENEGDKGASAVIVPDRLGDIDQVTAYLVEDAVRRSK